MAFAFTPVVLDYWTVVLETLLEDTLLEEVVELAGFFVLLKLSLTLVYYL